MLEVHEVWDFEKGEEGLFAEYVDTWLKIKTEAKANRRLVFCRNEK